MDTWAIAFLGGILGAVLMDLTEAGMGKADVSSGVTVALVGRWVLGWRHGRLVHNNILNSKALPHEVGVGWAFHFLVGGGAVALAYPLFFEMSGLPQPANHLLGSLAFGLATSALPWFVLLPCFGWGIFGVRGPEGSRALLAATLSHIPYGLGLGVAMTAGPVLLAT